MMPKVVGLIMIIMGAISLCVIVACLVKGIYDSMEDYGKDSEV